MESCFKKPIFDFLNSSIWVEHYQKCAEILSANFVLLFNNIEVGKTINYLFAFFIFNLSFFTFNKFKTSNTLINLFLSTLIILNPVSTGQIRTYYVDFIVYYLFAGILLSIILKEKDFISNKLFLLLSISQISILCNIKLGGIFYSIILVLSYFIYSLITKKYNNFKTISCIISLSIILVLISGINPYFTNIKNGHHPFYPLAGEGKMDIMTGNSPKSFEHKNSLYKLFISTFSNTKNITYVTNDTPKLKIPFSLKHLNNGAGTDVRIGGFGYFWSEILLLLIPFVILVKNSNEEDNKIYYFVITTLWLSVLLNPESWWARYVPQFWLVPIFIIFWKSLNENQNKNLKIFSYFLILLLFINSYILEIQNLKLSVNFSKIRNEFFKEVTNKNISVYIINSIEKETMNYKLTKMTKSVKEISSSDFEKNKNTFKCIPLFIIDNKSQIGVYRVDE